ncbi:hypothetical protein [Streptosporangium minutum]|uniref:hypothetical protein n=1 Tax=Streptosporangium minutum TaxID=569862 RepID=UPI001054864C|nr:hypothetical protein [Streptosporangium minutum]
MAFTIRRLVNGSSAVRSTDQAKISSSIRFGALRGTSSRKSFERHVQPKEDPDEYILEEVFDVDERSGGG